MPDQDQETPLALVDKTVCSSLPPLPEKRRSGFLAKVNQTLFYCGGRQSLLEIRFECWKFDIANKTWVEAEPLPRSLTGASAIGLDGKLWVFGGTVEEDFYENRALEEEFEYYQAQVQNEYYYDYVIEKTGSDVFTFDLNSEKWEEKGQLPMPLQGSCPVNYKNQVLILGGKNEKNFPTGSNQVWQFDPELEQWSFGWPSMIFEKYYHGCTLLEVQGKPAIAVGGGRCPSSQKGCSENVEILILPTDKDLDKATLTLEGIVKWEQLPNTNHPHSFTPAMGYVDGHLYIVGGGDFALLSSGDKIERFQDGRWWSFGNAPVRAFGSYVSIPQEWLQSSCQMEPNLGIRNYFQRRTKQKLDKKKWLCFEDQLLLSDQDTKSGVLAQQGCTIPGCNYPHVYRKVENREKSTAISCQVNNLGLDTLHVECSLECRQGLTPAHGINSTVCNLETVQILDRPNKLTNFTKDYLECTRDIF